MVSSMQTTAATEKTTTTTTTSVYKLMQLRCIYVTYSGVAKRGARGLSPQPPNYPEKIF